MRRGASMQPGQLGDGTEAVSMPLIPTSQTPEGAAEIANDPQEARLQQEYLRKIPLRRAGVPRDQAMAVLFLASDDAAWITGQTIIVDGGELGGGDWYDRADAPPLPGEDLQG